MDQNLVIRSQPISKGERKRLIFLGLRRKPIKPLHGACSVHKGLRSPLDGVKVQSTFLRGSLKPRQESELRDPRGQPKRERERKKDMGTRALMEQRCFNQHGVGIYTVLSGSYSQQR